MAVEISVFDPDSIQTALDRDLVGGLRSLADALESGAMSGVLLSAEGVGSNRCEASVLVRVVVSAPVRMVRRVEHVQQLGCGGILEMVD
jgi:hypothetical protein